MGSSPLFAQPPRLHQSLIASILRLDRTRVSLPMAIRNSIGFAIPLVLLAALGRPALGVIVGIGTLNVAFADQAGTDYTKAARMVATSIGAAISVFAGATIGEIGWLSILVLAMWGLGGGMLAAFGRATTQIGATAIVCYLVMTGNPQRPADAFDLAILVLGGGLFQTLLSMIAWPVVRTSPSHNALALTFRELASYAERLSQPIVGDPPASAALLEVGRVMLRRVDRDDPDSAPDVDEVLFDHAQRLQTDLMGVGRLLLTIGGSRNDAPDSANLGRAISDVLSGVAEQLTTNTSSASLEKSLLRLDHAIATYASLADVGHATAAEPFRRDDLAFLIDQVTSLRNEIARLADAVEIAADRSSNRRMPLTWSGISTSWTMRLHEGQATILANLSRHSAIFRHALRLAVCLIVADTLVRLLNIPHGYWAPMAVALILRPDFETTLTRGGARLIGTGIGLVLATILLHYFVPGLWPHVALVITLTFLIRVLSPANSILAAVTVSAYVVALLALVGVAPATTVDQRALNTAIGGALALASFIVWPTWEVHRVPDALAEMLGAIRQVAKMTLLPDSAVDPTSTEIHRLRTASRLARSNATASVNRMRNEPGVTPRQKQEAQQLVTHTRELAISLLTLSSYLQQLDIQEQDPTVRMFFQEVDDSLAWLEASVKSPGSAMTPPREPSVPGWPLDQSTDTNITVALEAEARHLANIIGAMTAIASGMRGEYVQPGNPPVSVAPGIGTDD